MFDLERLWLVRETLPELGSHLRRIGKTHYWCHILAGYLQVLNNETIVVLLDKLDHHKHFLQELKIVLKEYDIEILDGIPTSFRWSIKNNTNCIKIMSLETISRMHPIDTGASHDTYIITDLNDMPRTFFQEDITPDNVSVLENYITKNQNNEKYNPPDFRCVPNEVREEARKRLFW